MNTDHGSPYPSDGVAPTPAPAFPTRPVYPPATARDLRFALLFFLTDIFVVHATLWGGAALGASCAIALLGLLSAVYLLGRHQRPTVCGVFSFLLFLACAVALFFTDSGGTKFLLYQQMILLAAVALLECGQLRQYHSGGFRAIADLIYMIFGMTFGRIGAAANAVFRRDKPHGKHLGNVLLGLLVALPVLLIVVPLLCSADAAFDSLIGGLIAFDSFGELVLAGIVGLLLFFPLFGRLFTLPHTVRPAVSRGTGGNVNVTAVTAFLGAISAVYALYFISQLAYFVNAFAGLLPKNFTVAEYARRGFFEMTFINALNLLIVFLSNLVCRKTDGKTPLSVRLLSLFLCIFSLFLCLSVGAKLGLYIDSFGMTKLRILTSLFTVLMFVTYLSVALHLFIPRVPYMKIAFAAATLLLLMTSFVGVDRTIAHYNITAYLDGRLETVDTESLEQLDPVAIANEAVLLLDAEDPDVAEAARAILNDAAVRLFEVIPTTGLPDLETPSGSWYSLTLPQARARETLLLHADEFLGQ